ncbi:hypothetical protein BJ165DRAFT_1608639 [Panaeolus papilionaceus]|nr:hypothetical protein BJ165DRAFT_1608639 [Panaeolus papilionaceus]
MSSVAQTNYIPAYMSDSYVSLRSAFNDLPTELIREIFLYVGYPKNFRNRTQREEYPSTNPFTDFLSLMSVSQRLLNIGRSTKEIWSWHIDFTSSLSSIRFFLELSNPLPLTIQTPTFICDPQCCLDGRPLLGNHPRYDHWDLLIRQNILASRCYSLELKVDYCMWDILRLHIEPQLFNIQKLSVIFTPSGMIFGHVADSNAFPPKPFTPCRTNFLHLSSLTLVGGFFHLSPDMFPALQHLSVVIPREDMRGQRHDPQTGDTQNIYENWPAEEWHQLLVGLPGLRTVSLTNVIQLEDALRPPQQQTNIDTINLLKLKSLLLEDNHASIAKFLRPCVVSPHCKIKIRSTIQRVDLSSARFDALNTNLNFTAFLRNRFSSTTQPTEFGSYGLFEIQESRHKQIDGAPIWSVKIANGGPAGLNATPLSLKFAVLFPNSKPKWKHRMLLMLHQLLTAGLGEPLQRLSGERFRFLLNVESIPFRESWVSYRRLCKWTFSNAGLATS